MSHPTPSPLADAADQALAVLVSGGIDSAVLLAEEADIFARVYPIYVRTGLVWEAVELSRLQQFLRELAHPRVEPLVVLEQPVGDVYGRHWSTTGEAVPGADTPDEAVFLPGRNALLLVKPLLWCHLHEVPSIALAPLAANPFPDATPGFFDRFAEAMGIALDSQVEILLPYAGLSKMEVIRRGQRFPLATTFSCIRPVDGQHCGACNKCAERQAAFRAAEVADPTPYAATTEVSRDACRSPCSRNR